MTEKTNYTEMFRELVNNGIITYGGGNEGKNPGGYSAGVQYGETFAKCFTGLETLSSFDDLKSLYDKWVSSGRHWDGVIAWLSVKHGHLPLYWYADAINERGNFDLSTLNLPSHPNDYFYRNLIDNNQANFQSRDDEWKKSNDR